MSERSTLRLLVLQVLVISLFVTLIGRLFYLQVLSGETYKQAASDNRVREVITPAVRGLILDQAGRPMVSNRTSLVVSVDRTAVFRQKDKGKAVLTRLATALGTTYEDLYDRLQLCGTKEAKKPPVCWNGSPYQPIPVAKDVPTALALRIMEQRIDFPGVKAELEAVRQYPVPYGVNAAHVLGYLGPVTDAELKASRENLESGATELRRTDLVGRAGLESSYDEQLRGTPGVKQLAVDRAGAVTGTVGETDAVPGNYLVTNVDSRLQSVVETQLLEAVKRARSQGKGGDSGSAVVLDVTNGHVLAMASWPTYDPSVWVGGIGRAEYTALTAANAGTPLLARAVQGQYVPASTFKVVSAAAAAGNGFPLDTIYKCPEETKIGNRVVRNNESRAYGEVTLARAIEVSCNTVFAALGYDMWLSDGGNSPTSTARDAIEKTALGFGYGKRTGVDLPSEARGRVGGREFKQAYYDQYKDVWCERKDTGYPEVAKTDPVRAAFLKALAAENCADGNKFRGGDAANLAIGQGDTVVTPLQVAMVYSAIANGGTLWQPQVAKAVVASNGKIVETIKPKATGKLPMSRETMRYLQASLRGVVSDGTAAGVFAGFPVPLSAKTGSGQVQGKDPTTWMASYGPSAKPRYAVIMTVNQGQTGAETVGPSLRKVWEALLGVSGQTADPRRGVLVGGAPLAALPTVRADGTVVYPELRRGIPTAAARCCRRPAGRRGHTGRHSRAETVGELAVTAGYPSTALRGRSKARQPGEPQVGWWRRLDYPLVLSALALSLLGALLVWSATRQRMIDVGTRPAELPQEAPAEPGHRAGARRRREPLRLPAAAGLRTDPVRAVAARPGGGALPARRHHQRRPRVDPAADGVHAAAQRVRQDRDHRRDGDDPLGEAGRGVGSTGRRRRPGSRRRGDPDGADHASARPGDRAGHLRHRARDRVGLGCAVPVDHRPAARRRRRCLRRRAARGAGPVPGRPARVVRGSGPRPQRCRVQHPAGPHRDRLRRADGHGAVRRTADQRQVRAGAADRLRLHRRR